MEIVLVLFFAALVLTGPVALVVALHAKNEVRRVRRDNAELRSRIAGAASARTPGAGAAEPLFAPKPPAAAPPRRAKRRDVESVIGGEWLTWIGIVTIFFGTAFFVAVDLGEHAFSGTGQIVTGLLVGFLFIALGLRMAAGKTRRVLGQGLLGGGVALLFLGAYGAHGFHRLVSAPVVYVFLAGVSAIGALLALRRDSIAVAVLTVLGALATPIVLSPSGDPARFLFPYLVFVIAGTSHVGMRRKWPALTMIAFLVTSGLVAAWCTEYWPAPTSNTGPVFHEGSRWLVLGSVAVLWALFNATPIVAPARPREWGIARDVLILLSGLFFAWFLYVMLHPRYEALRGLAIVVLAAVYLVASRGLMGRTIFPARSIMYYTGIALATLAIPVQFDGEWITLGWVMLGFVLVLSGTEQNRFSNRALGLSVYAITVVRVLFFDSPRVTSASTTMKPIFNVSFLVGIIVVTVLAISAYIVHRRRDRLGDGERGVVPALVVAAAVALWWRITAETTGVYHARELATGAVGSLRRAMYLTISLVWAIYAGLLIAGGFIARYRTLRLLGVTIIGVLVVKVFLLDIQELERGYRIASFVGVGLLILAISAFYQRERSSS